MWNEDKSYRPIVWPYIKNKDLIWPPRSEVYTLDLNTSQNWEEEGKHRFSTSLIHALKANKNESTESLSEKK